MFAVIKTGGRQYRVAADDVLKIGNVSGNVGDVVEIGQVLAWGEGDKVTIGAPFVEGAMVTAEVVEQGRGPKVIAFKKRRRQNSRRKRGHRQLLTTVRIAEILTDGAKPSKKAAAKPAPKAEAETKVEAEAPKPAAKAKQAEAKATAGAKPAEAKEPKKTAKAEAKAETAGKKPARKAAPKKAAAKSDEE